VITYTIPQLDHMIDLAQQLGFWDDVAHWTAVRAEMKRGNS
jgi:hypothetical protein